MPLSKDQIKQAIDQALQDKGKRKFTQSVELAVNFKGVDFSKPDKRVNLEVVLPKGKGRECKIAVFADGQMALDAQKEGADLVIPSTEIVKLAGDRIKLKELSRSYEFLAQPNLMMQIGKSLGQYLGTRDKLPKPLMGGKIREIAEKAKKSVKLKNRGKNLPTIQCLVGTESMPAESLAENIETVLEALKEKVGEQSLKSAFVKLSMGKPAKIM